MPSVRSSPVLLLVLLSLLSGCGGATPLFPPPRSEETIRIVSSLPKRGPFAQQARQIANAVDLSVSNANRSSHRYSFEHIQLDGGDSETGDWSRSIEEANAGAAVRDPSVVAYLGPYTSGATGVALPITNRAGLLQLGPTATWPGLTLNGWNPGEPGEYYPTGNRNYVRLMPPDSRQAEAALQWWMMMKVDERGHEYDFRPTYDGSTYSSGLGLALAHAYEAAGFGEPLFYIMEPGRERGLASSIRDMPPTGVFYAPSTADLAARIAVSLSGLDVGRGIFATDTALTDTFLERAGASANGWHIVRNGWDQPRPSTEWEEFKAQYKSNFGEEPGQFAANAYDLASLVLQAASEVGRSRTEVLRRVQATRNKRGASGLITFSANGDREDWLMSGYVPADGAFKFELLLSSDLPK